MRTSPRSLDPGFVLLGAALRIAALTATAFGLAAVAAAAPSPSLPKPDRYVTDRAGILAPDRAAALNEKLAAFERQTSDQVVVWVDRRLPEGTTLEELGVRTLREWGVGQKGKSNGILFLIFTDDRRMRIEVGYGLEGALPDARAHRITDEIVKPRFRGGDFAGGIEAGADAILASVRGEPFVGTGKTAAESGGRAQARSRAPSPAFIAVAVGFLGFWALMAFLIIRGVRRSPAAAAARGGRTRGGWTTGSGEWSAASLRAQEGWSSTSSASGDSSSSSSSSDFSGGGGDGGGGGASDSW
jgi:uncharacterized protein